jgi:hypothetical protein
VVAQGCNPSTQKGEARGSQVRGQPGPHSDTKFQEKKAFTKKFPSQTLFLKATWKPLWRHCHLTTQLVAISCPDPARPHPYWPRDPLWPWPPKMLIVHTPFSASLPPFPPPHPKACAPWKASRPWKWPPSYLISLYWLSLSLCPPVDHWRRPMFSCTPRCHRPGDGLAPS